METLAADNGKSTKDDTASAYRSVKDWLYTGFKSTCVKEQIWRFSLS